MGFAPLSLEISHILVVRNLCSYPRWKRGKGPLLIGKTHLIRDRLQIDREGADHGGVAPHKLAACFQRVWSRWIIHVAREMLNRVPLGKIGELVGSENRVEATMHRMQSGLDGLPIQFGIAGSDAQEQSQVIAPGPAGGFHGDVVQESPLDLIPIDRRGRKHERIDGVLKLLPDERRASLIIRTISRHARTLLTTARRPILPLSVSQPGLEKAETLGQTASEHRTQMSLLVHTWPCPRPSGYAGDPEALHAGSHRSNARSIGGSLDFARPCSAPDPLCLVQYLQALWLFHR